MFSQGKILNFPSWLAIVAVVEKEETYNKIRKGSKDMVAKNIFSTQMPSGEIPTLMVNRREKRSKMVDTLAITMVAVYLAQGNRGQLYFS